MSESWIDRAKALLGKSSGPSQKGKSLVRWILPVFAVLFVLSSFLGGTSGAVEVEPGEVAVIYNNTGLTIFGEPVEVRREQGVIFFLPGFQRIEKLEIQPQIFVMSNEDKHGVNHMPRLTVRASDGSNFYFERLEIHYQVLASKAAEVIANNGPGNAYMGKAVRTHAREILRDAFGEYSFLQIADPRVYGEATSLAKQLLNERLGPLGIEVTNIPPPKPRFDERVEHAIEERQNAEQEVEVQKQKRFKLEKQKGRRLQQVEQTKSAEYQQLIADLEAQKQQATNRLIAVKREADKYFIEHESQGQAQREEQVTRARANEIAYRKAAEGMVARIRAVGEQGPDVLNREIAEHVFPQLEGLSARPYSRPSSPIDIRYLDGTKGGQ